MVLDDTVFTGGESVYCINEQQLRKAYELAMQDPASAPRLGEMLERIEGGFSRNEQAALAFVLIDRLLKSASGATPRSQRPGRERPWPEK